MYSGAAPSTLRNRALAGDFLAVYYGITRSPATSSQESRSLARCPSWPRSLPFVAPFAAPHGPARFCPSWPRSSVALFSALRGPARPPPAPGRRRRRRSPVRPSWGRVAAGQRCHWPGRRSAAAPSLARAQPAGNKYVPPEGVRSKTKRAGIEGLGKTCWMTLEQIRASSLKMIVVVVVVELSLLKNNYC